MAEEQTRLVIINSAMRTLGTPSDFTVTFHDGCIHANEGISLRVEVVDACLNRSWYTVSSSNNAFCLFDGTVLTTITIPVGFYDVYTLRSTLQALLGSDWSVTYNAITNCYTYIYTNASSGNVYAFVFAANRCNELMGFGVFTGTTGNVAYGSPLVSVIPVKVNKENSVLVHCDVPKMPCTMMDNCTTPIFTESDVLLKICNTSAPFDNMTYTNGGADFGYDLSATDITALHFYVTDENDAPLTLAFDWTITLRFVFLKEDDEKLLGVAQAIRDYLYLLVLNKHLNKIS